ncbi:uncharacterized protein LOC141562223 [Sminthopsis crassicaudata]|uniref:uncharacterized protein LOC141562223 n=1 Tax=Sminthopsis crassicaudata TaxID=9301 RepID=UPI003D69E79D
MQPQRRRPGPTFINPTILVAIAASHSLPETTLLSKGGGKPWAFRSDWSPPAELGEAVIGCRLLSVGGDQCHRWVSGAGRGFGAPAAAAAAPAGAAVASSRWAAGAAAAADAPADAPAAGAAATLGGGKGGGGRGGGGGGGGGGARGEGGGGEVMLAPGIRAATAATASPPGVQLQQPRCHLAGRPAEDNKTNWQLYEKTGTI